MKSKVIFFLLFITTAIQAQPKWNERVPSSNPFNNSSIERKYCFVSIGFDPANALRGGKRLDNGEQRNENALDLIARLGVGFETNLLGSLEAGITGEIFNAIDYRSIGLDANYVFELSRTQMVLFGGEGIFIFREGLDNIPYGRNDKMTHFAPAANLRYRAEAILGTPVFVEIHFRYVYRADIGYFWGKDAIPTPDDLKSYSGYVSVGVKF